MTSVSCLPLIRSCNQPLLLASWYSQNSQVKQQKKCGCCGYFCGEKLLKILSEFDLVDLDNPSWTWWRLGGRYEMLKSTVQFNQVSILLWLDTARERDGHLVEVVHWEQWSKRLTDRVAIAYLVLTWDQTRGHALIWKRMDELKGLQSHITFERKTSVCEKLYAFWKSRYKFKTST